MTVLTITAKTKLHLHLHPPLTEAREIKLLNFHKPAQWFKFNSPQEIKKIASEGLLDKQTIDKLRKISPKILTIPKDFYTLESLRKEIRKEQYSFEAKPKFKIKINSTGYYLTSKITAILDREFYKHLNLPEVIHKGKIYDIKSLPNKPLFLFCDIINSHKYYTGFDILGEVQLKPSNLLAVFLSEHYPSLEIERSRLPLNQLTLRIEDESGKKPQFNESITFSIEVT